MTDESVAAYNLFLNKSYFSAAQNIWEVLYSSNIVAHSCYAGVEESIV